MKIYAAHSIENVSAIFRANKNSLLLFVVKDNFFIIFRGLN